MWGHGTGFLWESKQLGFFRTAAGRVCISNPSRNGWLQQNGAHWKQNTQACPGARSQSSKFLQLTPPTQVLGMWNRKVPGTLWPASKTHVLSRESVSNIKLNRGWREGTIFKNAYCSLREEFPAPLWGFTLPITPASSYKGLGMFQRPLLCSVSTCTCSIYIHTNIYTYIHTYCPLHTSIPTWIYTNKAQIPTYMHK